MKTVWDNQQGSRDRQKVAVLVTASGEAYRFTGSSIPGVCRADQTGFHKQGKWSYAVFQILHHETTTFVSWHQDWGTGYTWPQASWDDGFLWLAKQAPLLSRSGFEALIREHWPKTAARWDEAARADTEFGGVVPENVKEKIEAARREVERLHTEAEEARKLAAELTSSTEDVRLAKITRDNMLARVEAARAEAAKYAGLDVATLQTEADALWREAEALEAKIIKARRHAEAKAKLEAAKAQLGNSLGAAFEKLGM